MTDREPREAHDVPGFGRIGGVDDPVARAEYGDDHEAGREHAAAERPTDEDHRGELLAVPTELRGDIRSYYEGETETTGFVHRLRSLSNELERHADTIEDRAEEAHTEGGERR